MPLGGLAVGDGVGVGTMIDDAMPVGDGVGVGNDAMPVGDGVGVAIDEAEGVEEIVNDVET